MFSHFRRLYRHASVDLPDDMESCSVDKNFMGRCMVTARSVGIAISYGAARLALLRCLELIDSRQDSRKAKMEWSSLYPVDAGRRLRDGLRYCGGCTPSECGPAGFAQDSRNAASSLRRAIAAASAPDSQGGTRRPSLESRISSGMPLMQAAMQGISIDMASISTTGIPSAKLARAKMSAAL